MKIEFDYKVAFKTNLKTIREERGLSQKDLASKLNVPVSTYANWEQGRREPSIVDIFRIIEILEIDANELFSL
ncbi:MAG: helix-turn-helix transcriptional regulator [Clostridia bacterium]|nr:helix-turn-helix transcriptional regulator [Clostridia bacterium]